MALIAGIGTTRNLSLLVSSNSKAQFAPLALAWTKRNQQALVFASTSSDSGAKKEPAVPDDAPAPAGGGGGGWLGNIFSPSRIHTGNKPHSRLLSASDFVYEMHYHDAKPDCSEDYIRKYELFASELGAKTEQKAELVGSFRVEVGNQDQFVHLWRYHDGFKQASLCHKLLKSDETLVKLAKEHLRDLRKRESQFMMSFSFWNHPQPGVHNCHYEMRSYVLKPGTMIDWANGWSKGITHRDNAVGGFFSQIGQLYMVHHIWRYQDLQVRKDVRDDAWRRPGWDECVAITVPNIVYLNSRWMAPNSFSPLR